MESNGPGVFNGILQHWRPCRRCGQHVIEADDTAPWLCPGCWRIDRSRYAGQSEFDYSPFRPVTYSSDV
jgi:rubrerythrin